MCYGHAAAARHQSPINPDPMGETALLCSKFSNTKRQGKGPIKGQLETSRARFFVFFCLKRLCQTGKIAAKHVLQCKRR